MYVPYMYFFKHPLHNLTFVSALGGGVHFSCFRTAPNLISADEDLVVDVDDGNCSVLLLPPPVLVLLPASATEGVLAVVPGVA